MADVARRKPTRLPGYDYSQSGVYFLTVCAIDNAPIFGRVESPSVGGGVPDAPCGRPPKLSVGGGVLDAPCVALSEYGFAVEQRLKEMVRVYDHISLLKYVIMPNHIHLLLNLEVGPSGTPAPTTSDRANQIIPAFISTMKRMTNKTCGRELWQRGYHDHVVRNDADYLRIWKYIDTNPAKWAEDMFYCL